MRKSNKRSSVMQAALELIAERGFHDAPMALIIEKAGVASGTIYHHFENKDILITELYRDLEEKIYATLREGYPVERPLRERFFHLTRKLSQYLIANPHHFRYMAQYYHSPYGIDDRMYGLSAKPGNQEIFINLFEEGKVQQILKDLPVVVLFSLAFAPLISLIRAHILSFIDLDEALIERTMEACWDAIKL